MDNNNKNKNIKKISRIKQVIQRHIVLDIVKYLYKRYYINDNGQPQLQKQKQQQQQQPVVQKNKFANKQIYQVILYLFVGIFFGMVITMIIIQVFMVN